ncbi:MAG: N-acetyltransferase [Myxococcota bacterium]
MPIDRLDESTGSGGASGAKRAKAIHALTLAFVRDPVMRWLFPTPEAYLTHFPRFAAAFGGPAFGAGTAWLYGDGSGAALWLPSGVHPDGDAIATVVLGAIEPAKHEAAGALMQQMAEYHPEEPHWYLAILGVDAARQGQGQGAALMREALARCDEEGRMAYLESSNPANVSFYQRHGFEIVGEIQAGDAPVSLPMRRPAR